MGKKADNPQLNIRVEAATMEILEAAIYARRLRGPQELLQPVLEEFASRLANQPGVKSAIRARQEVDAHSSGKLKSLRRENAGKDDAS